MKKQSYKLNFEKLCQTLSLGSLVSEPKRIFGGLLHRMYQIETNQGSYAIKALNPNIMMREHAMVDYVFSEKVAKLAYANGINAMPAMTIKGNNIHDIDGQYYLVFEWFDGRPIKINTVDINKCRIIGKLLCKIHNLDYALISDNHNSSITEVHIDWNKYFSEAKKHNVSWSINLNDEKDKLHQLEKQINATVQQISKKTVVSHGDLDKKNVLWNKKESPMIIDWESATIVNPSVDLIGVALDGSNNEDGIPNKEAFLTVINSYIESGGSICNDLDSVLIYLLKNKLFWLEYSIKLSLGIECNSNEEQRLGLIETVKTMNLINKHSHMIPVLLEWLKF